MLSSLQTAAEEAVYDWASYPVSWQALFTFFVLVALVPVVYVTCASRKVAAPEAKEGATTPWRGGGVRGLILIRGSDDPVSLL